MPPERWPDELLVRAAAILHERGLSRHRLFDRPAAGDPFALASYAQDPSIPCDALAALSLSAREAGIRADGADGQLLVKPGDRHWHWQVREAATVVAHHFLRGIAQRDAGRAPLAVLLALSQAGGDADAVAAMLLAAAHQHRRRRTRRANPRPSGGAA